MNNRLTKKMIPDPERFKLVKRIFQLYSTGNYSLKEVRNIITKAGLRSRNEKVLCVSNIQAILVNPFYYGAFKFNNELYQGNHKPAISKKLFDKVQEIMKDKSRPKKRNEKVYAFRGLLKCGGCDCAITSETQKGHNYYRCTKKKIPCSQKYVREESLNEQISSILQKV
ncbi:recombinase family protein, partial [Patescibacteria group bacterium]|nr:recombinase family protein [Patescibacteria group bacterium]